VLLLLLLHLAAHTLELSDPISSTMPEHLGQLTALQQLSISICHNLAELPRSVALLSRLKHLALHNCRKYVWRNGG
jgi:Leucine-rich repeat (LRR) protein